jgi:hypothetical protein
MKKILTFGSAYDILTLLLSRDGREVFYMEEKYGKKFGVAKTLPLAVSGMLMVSIVIIIAGVSVLGYGISKGNFSPVGLVLLLVGLVMLAYCIKVMMGNVTCYENGIVITQAFKKIEIPREKIAAIFWERPGANASNERVRTNVNVADIILVGGREHYKVSDGYYSNVEVLGLYQNEYGIPAEIKR